MLMNIISPSSTVEFIVVWMVVGSPYIMTIVGTQHGMYGAASARSATFKALNGLHPVCKPRAKQRTMPK